MLEKMKRFASANKKWLLIGTAVLIVLVAAALILVFCLPKDPADQPQQTLPGKATYTIAVTDANGAPLQEVGVHVYADATLQDFVWFARTDAQGKISFEADRSSTYHVVLKDIPSGYQADASYPLTSENLTIALKQGTMEDFISGNATLQSGDLMPGFTVMDVDGNELSLSALLKDKKAVVLNFWFLNCTPCKMEFPYLQQAYTAYGDQVAVIALNCTDSESDIKSFRDENGYTFAMATCDKGWADVFKVAGYPTTVVIDREGLISFIHAGSVTQDLVFENMFSYYSAEDYVSGTISEIDTFLPRENGTGTKEDPFEFGSASEIELTIEAGQSVFCHLYKMSGMLITAEDPDIWLTYNGEKYTPTDGVLSLVTELTDPFTPMEMEIGNSGAVQKTFTLKFSMLPGTSGNPYEMQLGQFLVDIVAGNDQGIYYSYTALQDEVITLECLEATAGVNYGFSIYNLNSYVLHSLDSTDGNKVLRVEVKAGDVLQIAVNTMPDEEFNYPAAQLLMNAATETISGGDPVDPPVDQPVTPPETQMFTVNVVGPDGKGVSGVVVRFTGITGVTTFTTDSTGKISAELKYGTYKVKIAAVPEGFAVNTQEFSLDDKTTSVKIAIEKAAPPEPETITYTVTVKDDAGKPVAGVQLYISSSIGAGSTHTTNASGTVTAQLPMGSYTASVLSVPDGYVMPTNGKCTLTEKAPSATMIVPQYHEPEPVYGTYTVTVTDVSGKAISGVKVKITGDGYNKTMTTDSSGKVTAELQLGTYKASIASVPTGYLMDTTTNTMTEASRSTTFMISKKAAVEPQTGTYSVTVKDENGKPVAGAVLKFSGSSTNQTVATDEKGVASTKLVLGTYQVTMVSVPDAYVLNSTSVTLTKTTLSKTISVSLKTADYTVTVKDTNGKAVSGVKLTISGASGNTSVTTNSSGVATAKLVVGNYTVKVNSVPSDYNLNDGSFSLTSANASTSIVLTLKTANYTVTVKDPAGNGIPGAVVQLTGSTGSSVQLNTDASGKITQTLVLGNYTVNLISIPDGYEMNPGSYNLTKTSYSVSIPVEIAKPTTGVYTVTVLNASGKGVSGVVLKFEGSAGSVNLTTDSSGKVSEELLLDNYTVTMVSAPSDYTVSKEPVKLSATVTSGSMSVSLATKTYKVTVKGSDGKAVSGVPVTIKGDGVTKTLTTNSSGVASVTLTIGSYTVSVDSVPEGYDAYSKTESLTKSKTSVTITLIVHEDPYTDPYGERIVLETGSNSIPLVPGKAVYVEFTPTKSGLYKITCTGGKITNAGSAFFVNAINPVTSCEENVKDSVLGNTYVYGITATGSNISGTVKVTRIGNAQTNYQDEPWTVYKSTASHSSKDAFTGNASNLTYVDVFGSSSKYKLTKGSDGLYRIDGKVVYVNLSSAPYLSFETMLQSTAIRAYFFDSNGNFVKKEEYSDCITEYITCAGDSGIHVLTDDLMYILKSYGESAGWWDPNMAYLFGDNTNVNSEIAWMFACCY